MNGLCLSVCVRKKDLRDGIVQTMPSKVSQGAADFEETLFVRCHVYYSSVSGTLKFEPRPFLIYVLVVDAKELDFGRSSVDLRHRIQESIQKNFEGTRIRQWDTSFDLTGKAKGGELVLKLGFQVVEKDGGTGIYSQAKGQQKSNKARNFSPYFGRKQSKSSFSVPSPRMSSRAEAWTPSQAGNSTNFQEIDDFILHESAPVATSSHSVQMSEEPESNMEDLDLLEFVVVEVEVQDKDWTDEGQSEENSDKRSVSSEVIKEILHDHQTRLAKLDSIAQQLKVLESMMGENKPIRNDEETESQKLDADEETVTKDFLQLLKDEEANEVKINHHEVHSDN